MPECDHCGADFDDEGAYLDHLGEAHEGDLSTIDARRVETHGSDADGGGRGPLVVGAVALLAVGVGAYFLLFAGGEDLPDVGDLPARGDEAALSEVRTFESAGATHVQRGTEIDYARMPPASGPHYASTVAAGHYTEAQPLGAVVHTLEHGAVVVYYDPATVSDEGRRYLRAYAATYTGTWQSVVAVPTPVENPNSTYVVTAWRHQLRMDEFDHDRFRQFVAEYLGRGPENPVR